MARQEGIMRFKGLLGDLIFYERNGKPVVRRKGSLNRKRIAEDAAFARTREDNAEFGGASRAGKVLRLGLAPLKLVAEPLTLTGRLTGLLRKMMQNGPGPRGKRALEMGANAEMLSGFELNPGRPFAMVYNAPCPALVYTPSRTEASWTLPGFTPRTMLQAPPGATHFKLVLALVAISDYRYDDTARGYVPVHAAENGQTAYTDTGLLGLDSLPTPPLELSAQLALAGALPVEAALVAAVGILFYQEVNGVPYLLKGGAGRVLR